MRVVVHAGERPSTMTRARTASDARRARSSGSSASGWPPPLVIPAFPVSVPSGAMGYVGLTVSSSCATSARAVSPSASAWKFGSTRWTSTGIASARTSSIDAA